MQTHRVLALLLIVGCGVPAAPAPPPLAITPPPPDPTPTVTTSPADQLAFIKAKQATMRAQEESAMAEAKNRKAEDAAERSPERICAKSRASRVERAKEAASDWETWAPILAQAPAIRAACASKDTRALQVETSHGGKIARIHAVGEKYDLVCTKPLPAGISKEDAWAILTRGDELDPNDPLIPESGCAKFDQAVGLNTEVLRGDKEGIKRLLQWKSP